jgi:ribonuclease HIII
VSADAEANELLQRTWSTGTINSVAAQRLRTYACNSYAELTDPQIAARIRDALALLPSHEAWTARSEDLHKRIETLLRRQHQIDQLGDQETPVEAIFEILGDELSDLDMSTFDREALGDARTSQSHPRAAGNMLDMLGLSATNAGANRELREVIEALDRRASRFPCHAMFATAQGQGHVLGVKACRTNGAGISSSAAADEEMNRQAEAVLRRLYVGTGAEWYIEWDINFGGNSIGLPLWIAAQADLEDWTADPLVAATGRLGPAGEVLGVGDVAAKVTAAARQGIRRILVPKDNLTEASEGIARLLAEAPVEFGALPPWLDEDLRVIGISHVNDVRQELARARTAGTIGHEGMVRLVAKSLPVYGLDLVQTQTLDDRYRIRVSDGRTNATIDIQKNRGATVTAGGSGTARSVVEALIEERLPASRIQSRKNFSAKVSSADRKAKLKEVLEGIGATQVETKGVEEFRYAMSDSGSNAVILGWATGSVVVQGTAPAWDHLVDAILDTLTGLAAAGELAVTANTIRADALENNSQAKETDLGHLQEAPPGLEGAYVPHIGTDEAGKGDYFGPLVCAAAFVDEAAAAKLSAAGVRDSKKLSDSSVHRLAEEIRTIIPGRWAVVAIYPERYNALVSQMRSEGRGLNSLVAWGHVRGIHQLADHGVWAPYVLVDQFADISVFDEKATVREGVTLELRTKAESDIAVATASILARSRFLKWLDETSAKLGMKLPKGAGPPVIEAARELVAARGPEVLQTHAKVSFRTTKTVLDAQK